MLAGGLAHHPSFAVAFSRPGAWLHLRGRPPLEATAQASADELGDAASLTGGYIEDDPAWKAARAAASSVQLPVLLSGGAHARREHAEADDEAHLVRVRVRVRLRVALTLTSVASSLRPSTRHTSATAAYLVRVRVRVSNLALTLTLT